MELSYLPSFAIEAISWIKYRVCHSPHVTGRWSAAPAPSSRRCLVLRLVLPPSSAQGMQPHCSVRRQSGCVQHSMQARGAFLPPLLTLTNTSLTCCLLQKETDTFKDLMLGTVTACTAILTSWWMGRKFGCFGTGNSGWQRKLARVDVKRQQSIKQKISRTRWPKLGIPMRFCVQFRVSF